MKVPKLPNMCQFGKALDVSTAQKWQGQAKHWLLLWMRRWRLREMSARCFICLEASGWIVGEIWICRATSRRRQCERCVVYLQSQLFLARGGLCSFFYNHTYAFSTKCVFDPQVSWRILQQCRLTLFIRAIDAGCTRQRCVLIVPYQLCPESSFLPERNWMGTGIWQTHYHDGWSRDGSCFVCCYVFCLVCTHITTSSPGCCFFCEQCHACQILILYAHLINCVRLIVDCGIFQ